MKANGIVFQLEEISCTLLRLKYLIHLGELIEKRKCFYKSGEIMVLREERLKEDWVRKIMKTKGNHFQTFVKLCPMAFFFAFFLFFYFLPGM